MLEIRLYGLTNDEWKIIIAYLLTLQANVQKKQSFQLIMAQPHVTRPRIADPAEILILA